MGSPVSCNRYCLRCSLFCSKQKNDQTSTQQITEQKELSPDEAKRFATGLLKKLMMMKSLLEMHMS